MAEDVFLIAAILQLLQNMTDLQLKVVLTITKKIKKSFCLTVKQKLYRMQLYKR